MRGRHVPDQQSETMENSVSLAGPTPDRGRKWLWPRPLPARLCHTRAIRRSSLSRWAGSASDPPPQPAGFDLFSDMAPETALCTARPWRCSWFPGRRRRPTLGHHWGSTRRHVVKFFSRHSSNFMASALRWVCAGKDAPDPVLGKYCGISPCPGRNMDESEPDIRGGRPA